jgi:hypothetical protein
MPSGINTQPMGVTSKDFAPYQILSNFNQAPVRGKQTTLLFPYDYKIGK